MSPLVSATFGQCHLWSQPSHASPCTHASPRASTPPRFGEKIGQFSEELRLRLRLRLRIRIRLWLWSPLDTPPRQQLLDGTAGCNGFSNGHTAAMRATKVFVVRGQQPPASLKWLPTRSTLSDGGLHPHVAVLSDSALTHPCAVFDGSHFVALSWLSQLFVGGWLVPSRFWQKSFSIFLAGQCHLA